MNSIWILGIALGCITMTYAAKIQVERERMINVSASGDVYHLFDEQSLAGDPLGGSGGTPVTPYTNGWIKADLYYPIQSIVDLGAVHELTHVYYYDINASDSLYVWCGDGVQWSTMVAKTTSSYNSWVANAVSCTGRYVKIQLKSPSTGITEMVLYGSAQGAIEPLPEPQSHAKTTLGDLMGVNGFIDDDRDLLAAVGHVREYHSWQWDDGNDNLQAPAYPNNRFAWNPSAVRWTGGGWNFDEFYTDLDQRGLMVAPVFQGVPTWLAGVMAGDSLKPMPLGADSTLPESYRMHGDYMYQFAARFGSATVPVNQLRVDAQNTTRSGLAVIPYMEGWNEPDKDWKGKTGYFSPVVLAALMSADYDGHRGAMGAQIGVKNADPQMKYVMPALINLDLNYVKSIRFWSQMNRAGSFPADVLNFHHYCNDAGGQGGEATTGISPEEDHLRERLETVVAWRDRWAKGKELWLSEFGWDTHPDSKFGAQAIGNLNEYEIQGRWIVRAYLEIAASGFDRAQMYMLRDVWDNSPGTFSTSGLVHDKYDTLSPSYEKKPSWYYVNTLHKTLKNFRYQMDLPMDNGIKAYRFVHQQIADSVAVVLWNPNDAATSTSVNLTWTGGAKIVRLTNQQALGTATTANAANQVLQINGVTGSPVIALGYATGPTRTSLINLRATSSHERKFNLLGQQTSGARGL